MVAGLNLVADVWTFSYPNDDDMGGAQPSGTIAYSNAQLRLQTLKPTQPLLEQGIESVGLFTACLYPHTCPLRYNDELEVKLPVNSPHYGDRFRIVGEPQRTSMSPSDHRGYLIVNVQRIEKNRSQQ